MTERVVGYSLLAIGVIVIIFSAVNVYRVFSGRIQPISLFTSQDSPINLKLDLPSESGAGTTQVPVQFGGTGGESPLNRPLNLAAHMLLMSFVGGVGMKLATLGTKLVRPIVVKEKNTKLQKVDDLRL